MGFGDVTLCESQVPFEFGDVMLFEDVMLSYNMTARFRSSNAIMYNQVPLNFEDVMLYYDSQVPLIFERK